MKFLISLATACFMWAGTALACEVEEWNYSQGWLFLEVFGVATCERGSVGIRLYDGEGESRKLLDVGVAFIRGYVFKTEFTLPEKPKALSVKFSIDSPS